MAETREITYPIRLTTAEMSYLLSMIKAQELIGGNNQALFPQDARARDAQWMRGRAELEQDGWLVHDGQTDSYTISPQLMLIIASMADPELALLTEWEILGQREVGLAHYIASDTLVEMTMQEDLYVLVVLDTLDTLTGRLSHELGFPERQPEELSFELTREEVDYAKRNPSSSWLEQRGLSPRAADLFAASLRSPERYGTVTLARTHLSKVFAMRLVGVLLSSGGIAWVATPFGDMRLRYLLAEAGDFEAVLASTVADLRALSLEQVEAGRAR